MSSTRGTPDVRWPRSFNEAGAWEPRMSTASGVEGGALGCFNEAGAWEPRMSSRGDGIRLESSLASMRPGLGSPG